MRQFFRIIIGFALVLILIIQIFQFTYFKYFAYQPSFELLPNKFEYALFKNTPKMKSNNKFSYYLNNLNRFHAGHTFQTLIQAEEEIFTQATCNNNKLSYVTILKGLKPSQFTMLSNHKSLFINDSIYITDLDCELIFDVENKNSNHIKDLIANVALTDQAYYVFSKEFTNKFQNFFPVSSPLIGSISLDGNNSVINSYALHSNNKLRNLSQNLSPEDLSCHKNNSLYFLAKEAKLIFSSLEIFKQEFFNNFESNFQLKYDEQLAFCNKENSFELKSKVDLEKVKTQLPDKSYSTYLELDFQKIFEEVPNQNSEKKQNVYNPLLLKKSDAFLYYEFGLNKSETYFNFLSDSFNSVTYIYE